jgi:hypothetical protein
VASGEAASTTDDASHSGEYDGSGHGSITGGDIRDPDDTEVHISPGLQRQAQAIREAIEKEAEGAYARGYAAVVQRYRQAAEQRRQQEADAQAQMMSNAREFRQEAMDAATAKGEAQARLDLTPNQHGIPAEQRAQEQQCFQSREAMDPRVQTNVMEKGGIRSPPVSSAPPQGQGYYRPQGLTDQGVRHDSEEGGVSMPSSERPVPNLGRPTTEPNQVEPCVTATAEEQQIRKLYATQTKLQTAHAQEMAEVRANHSMQLAYQEKQSSEKLAQVERQADTWREHLKQMYPLVDQSTCSTPGVEPYRKNLSYGVTPVLAAPQSQSTPGVVTPQGQTGTRPDLSSTPGYYEERSTPQKRPASPVGSAPKAACMSTPREESGYETGYGREDL